MKKICSTAILILSFLFSFSQEKIQHIRFGTGGGFSGIETIYSLNKKGQINIIQETLKGASSTFVAFISDKKLIKQLFEKAKEIQNIDYNVPDNTYSFLELRMESKKTRIVWGDKTKADPRVAALYDELMALINK